MTSTNTHSLNCTHPHNTVHSHVFKLTDTQTPWHLQIHKQPHTQLSTPTQFNTVQHHVFMLTDTHCKHTKHLHTQLSTPTQFTTVHCHVFMLTATNSLWRPDPHNLTPSAHTLHHASMSTQLSANLKSDVGPFKSWCWCCVMFTDSLLQLTISSVQLKSNHSQVNKCHWKRKHYNNNKHLDLCK